MLPPQDSQPFYGSTNNSSYPPAATTTFSSFPPHPIPYTPLNAPEQENAVLFTPLSPRLDVTARTATYVAIAFYAIASVISATIMVVMLVIARVNEDRQQNVRRTAFLVFSCRLPHHPYLPLLLLLLTTVYGIRFLIILLTGSASNSVIKKLPSTEQQISSYIRAIGFGFFRKKNLKTLDPKLPHLSVALEYRADPRHLESFYSSCFLGAASSSSRLFPTYLQCVSVPLQLLVVAKKEFPYPVLGSVNVRNTITQFRPIAAKESVQLVVKTNEARLAKRGIEWDTVTQAIDRTGVCVWECTFTALSFGPSSHRSSSTSSQSSSSTPPSSVTTSFEPSSPPFFFAQFQVPGNIGRKYGRVSNDLNPIHTSSLLSPFFGFPKPIAHGMWVVNRCLALLWERKEWKRLWQAHSQVEEGGTTMNTQPALQIRTSFRKPVPVGGSYYCMGYGPKPAEDTEGDSIPLPRSSVESMPFENVDVEPAREQAALNSENLRSRYSRDPPKRSGNPSSSPVGLLSIGVPPPTSQDKPSSITLVVVKELKDEQVANAYVIIEIDLI